LIIEHVSGMHYGDYMRTHVFAPLHMTHTFVGGYAPGGAVLAQGCKPGETASAARIPVRPIMEASTYGAGGISTTAQDWAHWYDALNRGRLLSPRSMQAMFTAVTLPDGTNTGYGMGMEVDDFRGEPRRGHNGQTQGFVADYASFPNRRLGFLILADAYGAETSVLMRALQVRAMPDLSYDRLPAATDPDPARGALIRRAIRQMILAEEPPFALLSERLRSFPTDPQGADQRARLHDVAADMARFEYLRSEPPPNGGFERYLYRVTRANGDTSYFTVSWSNGQLVGLRWYDE
jgi:CubicO group peptidase (beta-lactamase class C family)